MRTQEAKKVFPSLLLFYYCLFTELINRCAITSVH